MNERMIIAGFGGQGVMVLGQLLAYAGMVEEKFVSWIPSYGAEMRGGTANCSVVISDKPIASPVISNASTVFAFNLPSLEKFQSRLIDGGRLFVNTSLIKKVPIRDDVQVIEVPANDVADDLGNIKVANMVMLGAYLKEVRAVSYDSIIRSLMMVLPKRRHNLIPLNEEALRRGASFV
jgi:2-oxoglutarate ferredoxin oxidoreductase subunit gamma